MSVGVDQALFFVSLPDLRKLCSVIVTVQVEDVEELRNTQVKTCRELLLLYSEILASPVLDYYGEILVVMAISFYKREVLQTYVRRHNLQMSLPQRVHPSTLQAGLSYSLPARLAPDWNKAGQYLLAGRDFLSESGRLNAIVMELNTNESQLCVSVEANTVRLPPARLEDFELPPLVLRKFLSQPDSVVQTPNNWCYILPSMKKGQIVRISRQLPRDCPFQSYADLHNHWSSLYGYRLPQFPEQDVVYCSVYFKLVGQRLFTYPLSCIRSGPVQRCPRTDLQRALGTFSSDLRDKLHSICGFSVRMTSKPCYHTNTLLSTASAQMSSGKPVNLTTKSTSRPVLTQLPAARSVKPSFGSQPLARCSDGGHNLDQGNTSQTRVLEDHSAGPRTQTNQTQAWASSFSSLYPSSAHPRSSRPPQEAGARIVPIFKNKSLTRHVNVTQLLAEKKQSQHVGGPSPGRKIPAPSSSSSSSHKRPTPSWSSSSSSQLLSASTPRFTPRPQLGGGSPHPTQGAPSSQGVPPGGVYVSGAGGAQFHTLPPPAALGPADIPSNRGGDWFESKPKKAKPSVQDVDVEKYARSNQLSKVNTATLQAWLRERGVTVRSKDRKNELVSKVMGILSEA
ncbi:uncharacterized protein C18orf63-like [Hypomesus transpacificus]|uniref:uncharacterized protein C18orf63-like n=1 Tax=Hypomesus transpacificus TaxID=137520 RepID=UPI001F07DA2F|nr:uncharacterized protein C18orf63-like [Hypomesus transpacificus]